MALVFSDESWELLNFSSYADKYEQMNYQKVVFQRIKVK